MSKRIIIGIVAVAAAIALVNAGFVAWFRVRDARMLSRPYSVKTPTGTNYVVQLRDITVGKASTGYVLLVTMRLENPNAFELELDRRNLILVDHTKEYYWPSMTGTQTSLIHVPPKGSLDKEMLSFVVTDEALQGTLALEVGWHYMVMLKEAKPFKRQMKSGEFISFRGREW